jgi:hypothetical protein
MADFDGELLTAPNLLEGNQDVDGDLRTAPSLIEGNQDTGGEIFSSGGGAPVLHFKLRARDSACIITNPNRYVEWTTTSTPLTVASYIGALPCGGPLVELTVLSILTS